MAHLITTYVVVLVVGMFLGAYAYSRLGPQPTVRILPADTKIVYLPKTEIKYQDVVKFVTDKTEVSRLLAENKVLHQSVTQLNETIATYHATNSGPVVVVPSNTVTTLPPNTTTPTVTRFKDWRLEFVSNGQQATYQLTQRFEVLSTTAKDAAGLPVTATKLFEIGPQEERVPITDAKTTSIIIVPADHLYVHLNIQAGVAVTNDVNGAVIGAQWLKRGKTHAPADTRYAFATPVLFVASGVTEAGILPVSINVGTLPHQPFTNIWLSPYVGISINTRSVSRVGIAFSATF